MNKPIGSICHFEVKWTPLYNAGIHSRWLTIVWIQWRSQERIGQQSMLRVVERLFPGTMHTLRLWGRGRRDGGGREGWMEEWGVLSGNYTHVILFLVRIQIAFALNSRHTHTHTFMRTRTYVHTLHWVSGFTISHSENLPAHTPRDRHYGLCRGSTKTQPDS